MTTSISKLGERFEEKFPRLFVEYPEIAVFTDCKEDVKSFILQFHYDSLSELRKEAKEIAIIENDPLTYQNLIMNGERADGLMEGYNRALSLILQKLDERLAEIKKQMKN